ncbi:MAG: competence protein ComEC [Parcubacteria bacterium C7867-005]|nr:MAG: competence protein ComEC [Parcubacteria bacterium C7867-005]
MESIKKNWKTWLVVALILGNICVWAEIYVRRPSNLLNVYFFDVGQGDSIFVDTPTHKHILIDGGSNNRVLSMLGEVLPFGDRKIDVLLATHPDRDHIGGLSEVVSRFDVKIFISPGIESPTTVDDELDLSIQREGSQRILAKRGTTIDFGDGVKLVLLFPDRDVSDWETNDASIVAKLVYGEHSFLLTGDSSKKTEYLLLGLNEEVLDSTVLKAGHHGSRTSTSLSYAQAVSPEYTIISAGKGNSYGHPHKEVIDVLNKIGTKILSTFELGTIRFKTNGESLEVI